MKRLIFLLAILMVSCKKDEQPPLPSCDCTLVVGNLESYAYIVTFQGWSKPGATLQPGDVRTFTGMPAGKSVTVKGDLQTPFAHYDFSEKVYCPGTCETIAVYLKQ